MSGTFDPRNEQYEGWPWASKRTLYAGTVGQEVGYLEGVMFHNCSQWQLFVDPPPGPWRYISADVASVKLLQQFWSLPITGVVDAATWGVVDYIYAINHP